MLAMSATLSRAAMVRSGTDFIFAWNGLLLGILSVRQMEKITEKFFPGRHELFFLIPVCL